MKARLEAKRSGGGPLYLSWSLTLSDNGRAPERMLDNFLHIPNAEYPYVSHLVLKLGCVRQ
jgi:hypothetical protein